MAFVPEGQADRSLARSASGTNCLYPSREPRPDGTVEVMVTLEWREGLG